MGFLNRFVTFLIVFIFVSSGILKLTNKVNPDIHKHMKEEFVKFAKVHPFTVLFGYPVEPNLYRIVIGWVEVVGGALLVVGPAPLKVLTQLIFMMIMIGAVYTLHMVGAPLEQSTPAVVTFVLLCISLFLMSRAEEAPIKETKTE